MLMRTLFSLAALTFLCGCSTDDPSQSTGKPVDAMAGSAVVETMDSGGYTYVHLEKNGKRKWYAVPECAVSVGDRVEVEAGAMEMRDFESKTLARTFDVIWFAGGLQKVSSADASATPAAAHDRAKATAAAEVEKAVAKADGGLTVAEIFAKGKALAGEQIVLRGEVVKYNEAILGKNWVHVQDGTGGEGSNDITVTTADTCDVGDTVLIKGTLVTDKDFGSGYFYELLIEDASVTVE